ncbi:MAG: IPT/TIG domain-containing protein [Candidatus Omnitrophica bacterium]|nr:IPT/TIG domain-containing protein [Candidatus Omnitrophota bacterium]
MRKPFIAIALLFISSSAYAAAPVLFYSDLTSGPNSGGQNDKGAFVTIWGNNFGAARGSSYVTVGDGLVDNYPEWSDTKVCFQLGSLAATGNIVIKVGDTVSNGIPFTVRSGNIYFITPAGTGTGTFTDPFAPGDWYLTMAAGDIGYFRAGTYNETYGDVAGTSNFCFRTIANGGACNEGTAAAPIAFAAYPAETVSFSAPGPVSPSYNFRVYPGGTYEAKWFTFSKLDCSAYNACFTAGTGWRIVGNDCEGLTRTTALAAGIIGTLGESAKILGNDIHGAATNDHDAHAVYAQGCLSDGGVEIGWNHIYDNDADYGTLVLFLSGPTGCGAAEYIDDSSVHDNIIDASSHPAPAVGLEDVSAYSIDPEIPVVSVYNNVIIGAGNAAQGSSAIYLSNGKAKVFNNTCAGTLTRAFTINEHADGYADLVMMDVEVYNNIMDMDSGAAAYYYIDPAYSGSSAVDYNAYFGLGTYSLGDDAHPANGDPLFTDRTTDDYSLTSTSPCRDAGTEAVNAVVTRDINGRARPDDLLFDIGAYEYASSASTVSAGGSGGGGGACFIATVVYGDAREKRILERFRDDCLLKNRWGQTFVRWYYRLSPAAARYIRKRERLRLVLKGMLRPVVWLAEKSLEK